MRKTVLLTGATGFVGRQIYKQLLTSDVGIRIIARESSLFKLPELESTTKILFSKDLFEESSQWWASALEGVHLIIHAAWYAEPGHYLESEKNIDCLIGTLKIAKATSNSKVKKFVGIGSCFEYDLSCGVLSTKTRLQPKTLYAVSKVAAFEVLSTIFTTKKIEFAWCRLFYLFGEGEDSRRFIPYLHLKLSSGEVAELTSGNQIRDYLNVQDAARLIVSKALGSSNGPINICSCEPQTVRAIAEKIADGYGRRNLLKFGARPENLIDPPIIVGSID